jgi:hypothetical protein
VEQSLRILDAFQVGVQALIDLSKSPDLLFGLVIHVLHWNQHVYGVDVKNLAFFGFVVDCLEQTTSRRVEDMRNRI